MVINDARQYETTRGIHFYIKVGVTGCFVGGDDLLHHLVFDNDVGLYYTPLVYDVSISYDCAHNSEKCLVQGVMAERVARAEPTR